MKNAISVSLVLTVALTIPVGVRAAVGSAQVCSVGATCTIGEFLYDDTYVPVTTGTCTITSRYPDGTVYLNSEAMTGASDGWYQYSFTTPSTTGLYRTQVCCTVGSDYMCLDKGFEASSTTSLTSSEIASAVWGYSTRTMTGFGDLVSDIWSNSSRTLSSFGTMAQDVWNHNPRALTTSGTEASSTDISAIKKTVDANRLLLEKLVNKPIIQNFIEEEKPDLGAQIGQTRNLTDQMNVDVQYVVSEYGLLMLKWDSLTADEVTASLDAMAQKLDKEGVLGQAEALKKIWNWNQTDDVYDQTLAVSDAIAKIEKTFKGSGGWKAAYSEAKVGLRTAERLEKMVSGPLASRVSEVEKQALALDASLGEIDKTLAEWRPEKSVAMQEKIEKLGSTVLALNKLPKGQVALAVNPKTDSVEKRLKNRLLSMRGLIDSNKMYLAKGSTDVFKNTWLEEGSVVFKSLVTNPSTLIRQDVAIKYYLPPEVKKEDVLDTDEGLSVSYDSEKNQYFVEGTFSLKPGESRTVSVHVTDIWVISDTELNSMRKQTDELVRPLEKTAYFAQGVTLKSDIDVALDKIEVAQKTAVTPDQKIRAWRESQLEMGGVKIKMEKLKEVVVSVSSSRNLLGFVGGTQALAVWGIIIILVAGFVFLAIYMRTISRGTNVVRVIEEPEPVDRVVRKNPRNGGGSKWKVAFVIFVSSMLSSGSSVFVMKMMEPVVKPVAPVVAEVKGVQAEAVGGPEIVRLVVDNGAKINLRAEPSLTSKIITKLTKTEELIRTEVDGRWSKLEWEDGKTGWVSSEFIEEGVVKVVDSHGER